jgi:hypothetical protein
MIDTSVTPPPPQQIVNPFAKVIDLARQGLGMQSRLTPEGRAQWEPQVAPPPSPPAQPGAETAIPTPTPAAPVLSPQTVQSSFIPPRSDRPPGQIGGPWWPVEAAKRAPGPVAESQLMPSTRDAHRYIQQAAARQMAQGAPPSVAGPLSQVSMLAAGFAPLFDLLSQGAFSRGFSEGNALQIQKKLGALRLEHEQFLLQTEIASQAQQKILSQYDDVLSSTQLTPQQKEELIGQIAGVNQDTGVQLALSVGGLKTAMSHIQQADRDMRIMQAGHTSLKKMTEGEKADAEIQAEYGHGTDISGQGLGASPAFNAPSTIETAAGAAPVEAPEVDKENPFDAQMAKNGYTPKEIADAHRAYNQEFDLASIKGSPGVYARVSGLAGDLSTSIDKIAAGPADDPDHPENSKIEQIRRIDPDAAATFEGLKNYQLDPADNSIKNRLHMARLTSEIFPGYKQGFYKVMQNTYLKEDSPEATRIQAANRVGSQVIPLLAAINSLPINESDTIPETVWADWMAKGYTNDPIYSRLNETLGAFARESVATQTGARGGAVSYVNQMMKGLNLHEGKAALRAVVRDSVSGTDNIIEQHNNTFKKNSGLDQDMPGFDPETKRIFSGIKRGNPYMGTFAKDAPEDLKMVSPESLDPKGEFRKERPAWMTPNQDWAPIPEKQYNALKAWLDANPDDARADAMRHKLGIMR